MSKKIALVVLPNAEQLNFLKDHHDDFIKPIEKAFSGVVHQRVELRFFSPRDIFDDIEQLDPKAFDGLCLFGSDLSLSDSLAPVLQQFHELSSPILAAGDSVELLVQVFRGNDIEIGFDQKEELFTKLQEKDIDVSHCPSSDFITDRFNKLITTPAAFSGDCDCFEKGFELAVLELIEMS